MEINAAAIGAKYLFVQAFGYLKDGDTFIPVLRYSIHEKNLKASAGNGGSRPSCAGYCSTFIISFDMVGFFDAGRG